MTRTRRFVAAVLFAAAVGTAAFPDVETARAGQLKKGPAAGWGQPLRLKGVGKEPKQTPQASAAWWADRLIAELGQLRADAAAAKVPPPARRALAERIDAAAEKAVALDRALAKDNRPAWYREYGETEAALAELGKAAGQHAADVRPVQRSLERVEYASQQLGAVIAAGDPGRLKEVVARLGAAQSRQAERLLATADSLGAPARPLEKEARQFARGARQFAADAGGPADLGKLRRDFPAVAAQWQAVAALVARTPNLSPLLHYQAARLDGLDRQLASLLTPDAPPPPPVRPEKVSVLAVGSGAGMDPRVVVYGDDEGTVVQSFYAYNRDLHKSGIRVAVADLNGDGMPELLTINGGQGHARLKVFDGRDTNPLLVIDGFGDKVTPWGYFVAAADLTADGRALVAIAPDAGGPPAVEVYDLAAGRLIGTVQPFPREFDGGVRLAWGDVNGDGSPDLVTASGPGKMASRVRVYDGANLTRVLGEFLGVDEQYTGGLWVAAADLTKSNRAEIVVGLDAGHRPLVRVFEGVKGKAVAEFEPYPRAFRGGVRVAVGDPDDRERLKVMCAPGPGGKDLPIRVLRLDGRVHAELDPFPNRDFGMYVGSR